MQRRQFIHATAVAGAALASAAVLGAGPGATTANAAARRRLRWRRCTLPVGADAQLVSLDSTDQAGHYFGAIAQGGGKEPAEHIVRWHGRRASVLGGRRRQRRPPHPVATKQVNGWAAGQLTCRPPPGVTRRCRTGCGPASAPASS